MATILFDIFAAMGHYNASFLLAKRLSRENRVVYVCDNDHYRKIVAGYGFETFYVGSDVLQQMRSEDRTMGFWVSLFSFSGRDRKLRLKRMIRSYRLIREELHPDIVLLDSHHFYKAILYKEECISVFRFQSMVSTSKLPYIAPVNSDHLPVYTWKGNLMSELLWSWYGLKSRIRQWMYCLFCPTGRYYFDVKMLAVLCDYPLVARIDHERYTSSRTELKGYQELVISPIAFDFPSGNRKVLTCSFSPLEDRDKGLYVSRYVTLTEKLQFLKASGGMFIVYCSLGTLSGTDRKKAVCFWQKLKRTAMKDISLFFIFSIGQEIPYNILYPLTENIRVFRQVPQFDLLQYCDLMITHGGMNSITECILRQVPMLVYPLNRSWDQPGNAARVVFHGLGLKGSISRDSPMTIYRKIKKISSSYFVYKENLQKMKQKVEETPDTLTPYINSIV